MTEAAAPDPLATIRRFIEAFNADDPDAIEAACAPETTIVDDFPPNVWSGPGAAGRWYRAMAAMASAYGMAAWCVSPDEPTMVAVSGPVAYVALPVAVGWRQDGTPAGRDGFLTAALAEGREGWRIAAFTWTWP